MYRAGLAFASVLVAAFLLAWPAAAKSPVPIDPADGVAMAPESAGADAPAAGDAAPKTETETIVTHGVSAFGDLKYPADFKHFDYVNPDAPKGGVWSTGYGNLTFDSFNPFILKGNPAIGVGALVYDSLMASASDEPASMYGLIAESAEMPADRSWVAFNLRPEARFQDGTPITAEDVIFSFRTLRDKGHPSYRMLLAPVKRVTAEGPHRVRFEFKDGVAKRGLPLLVAGLPILSKKFYTSNDFTQSSLKIPVGSGPYRIGSYDPGQSVTFERVEDYWAADLPVNAGRHNFDKIRFEYFRDRSAAFEAFKAGIYLFREEFTSKTWATAYTPGNFPAIASGDVQRATLPDNRPAGTQGWWFNLRREKFQDIRVRKAIGLAFDFEWSNDRLFYDLYQRTDSFFEGGPMQAEGLPTQGELAVLNQFRDQLPPSIFSEPAVEPPITDSSGRNRHNLRKAARLLDKAGWKVVNGVRMKDGRKLEIEFLIGSQGFERIVAPFIKNLETIGVKATMRSVDAAQYRNLVQDFEFDITTDRKAMSLTPGIELRDYFGSSSADSPGSDNLAGISDPVVDGIIAIVERAPTREKLTAAVKALDRVLRAKHIWIPQWHKATHTIAFWDVFKWPDTKPAYAPGYPETWWSDAEKLAAMRAAGKL